jgi:hypothetical protein
MQGQSWEATALAWEWQNHGISFQKKPIEKEKCVAVQKNAEERVEIVRGREKNRENQTNSNTMKYSSEHWRVAKQSRRTTWREGCPHLSTMLQHAPRGQDGDTSTHKYMRVQVMIRNDGKKKLLLFWLIRWIPYMERKERTKWKKTCHVQYIWDLPVKN